jgi:hypothetical protein
MLKNSQKVVMRKRRRRSVPLDGCRVMISIAVRQPLKAPSDCSSTPWSSTICLVSSSDCPKCCRVVSSAFILPLRVPPFKPPSGTRIKEPKGLKTHQYSCVYSIAQNASKIVLQFVPLRRNLVSTSGLSRAIANHITEAVCPLYVQYVRRKGLKVWSHLPGI